MLYSRPLGTDTRLKPHGEAWRWRAAVFTRTDRMGALEHIPSHKPPWSQLIRTKGRFRHRELNSLTCLVVALEGWRTTVELHNDAFVSGLVINVDA
ncbi:hypothetical protein E2C01_029971 [Portunus trituberculatus]|uniref:Uncharacterized protein n=1 Tax=Portunus trituberculatus TaxID=210409 RepID=A0A5B7EPQ2_PORTR|nr:hypothetical protein [Portunus trituberculatus]